VLSSFAPNTAFAINMLMANSNQSYMRDSSASHQVSQCQPQILQCY